MDFGNEHTWRSLMATGDAPLVFKHAVCKWPSLQWTPDFLSQVLCDRLLDCKISLIQCEEFQWEPDCLHLKITMKQYADWLNGCTHADNPLRLFNKSKFSCYIDYKYMKDMFNEQPDILKSVCWEVFGLSERNGEHSTIWIGSAGTYTPCHQDMYGFNLVTQIQGRKRWYLFDPAQTENMYPTRIPYEESSVYSEVNVRYPDLVRHPLFQKTKPYIIELVPGDVLYVPNHWWHFVESLEPSISINTWVPIVEDSQSHLDEAVCRMLYTCLSTTLLSETESLNYLNTGEKLEDSAINLQYIQQAVQTLVEQGDKQNTQTVYSNIEGSYGINRQRKPLEKPFCDNFERFFNKFKNYKVTVAYLCGVDIGLPESLCSSGAQKRKHFPEDKNSNLDKKVDTEKTVRELEEDTSLKGKHAQVQPSDTEFVSQVNNKRQKVEADIKEYIPEGTASVNYVDVHCISSPQTDDGDVGCAAKDCDIEIFAAECFNFDQYLKFLKTVFDFDSNCEKTDIVVSDSNAYTKPELPLLTSSVTASALTSSSSPASSSSSVTSPASSSSSVTSLSNLPGKTSKVTVNTVDIINSILNPAVIRHIGQVLINKFKQ